jgi:hypothetical protein
MGCFDVYCLLCGNSCYGFEIEGVLDNIKIYEENPKKFKSLERIYKAYSKDKNFIDKLKKFKNDVIWIYSCTFLTLNNQVIHGCREVTCGNIFNDKNNNQYIHFDKKYTKKEINKSYGVFVHTDCWKYIKKEHGIELNFSHLPYINDVLKVDAKTYYPMTQYYEQYFNFIDAFIDGNSDYCKSPLVKPTIIKKVFSQLKIKHNPSRKSPESSASLYPTNTYKVGNNGNIWIKQNGKWMECKDTIKGTVTINTNARFNKYRFIGEDNTKPVFIEYIDIKGSKAEIHFIHIKNGGPK